MGSSVSCNVSKKLDLLIVQTASSSDPSQPTPFNDPLSRALSRAPAFISCDMIDQLFPITYKTQRSVDDEQSGSKTKNTN